MSFALRRGFFIYIKFIFHAYTRARVSREREYFFLFIYFSFFIKGVWGKNFFSFFSFSFFENVAEMGINAAEIGINATLIIINVAEIGINVADMFDLDKECGVIDHSQD